MAVPSVQSELVVVFGKAFLVALDRSDRQSALVFARALLSQLAVRPQGR